MFFQRIRRNWLPIALFFGFLFLYSNTLLRAVSTADNAEFQWVGATLGLAHPPGFPLYTLLANLVSKLPLGGSPAYRINLFSAFTSSLALVFVYLAAQRIGNNRFIATLSALALGVATTFWAQGTVANVRSMTALFAACAYYLLTRIYFSAENAPPTNNNPKSTISPETARLVSLFALTVGFGFTHHLSLAFIFLVMLLWLLGRNWHYLKYLPIGLLGLLPWLYLPIKSAELRTPSAFLNYALGLGFGGDFFAFISASDLIDRAAVMLNVFTFQMHAVLILAACLGLFLLLLKRDPFASLLTASLFIHTFISATYRAPQTVEYMLPAYIPLVLSFAGLTKIGRLTKSATLEKRTTIRIANWHIQLIPAAIAMLLIGLVGWQALQKYPSFHFLAHDTYASDYVDDIFEQAPENSLVLSNWHWFTTIKYQQEVAGIRPNLLVDYVVPEGESYAENWVSAIERGLAQNRPIISTNFYENQFAQLPAHFPLGQSFLWLPEPIEVPASFSELKFTFGDSIEILGYQLDQNSIPTTETVVLTVAWRSLDRQAASLFVHLIDQDEQLFGQDDVPIQAADDNISITRFELTPQIGSTPGRYSILLGAYLADGSPLLSDDGEARSQLADLTVTETQWRPFTHHPTRQSVANPPDETLIGFDQPFADPGHLYLHWQNENGYYSELISAENAATFGIDLATDLTCAELCDYNPFADGITLIGASFQAQSAKLEFVSDRPIRHDYAINFSVIGLEADGKTWVWRAASDSIPATGAIPSLKWIATSRVDDLHHFDLPHNAGDEAQMIGTIRIYDAFTNRPIPVLNAQIRSTQFDLKLFESRTNR